MSVRDQSIASGATGIVQKILPEDLVVVVGDVDERRAAVHVTQCVHPRHVRLQPVVRIGCLYLPNGNPAPGPQFDHQLRWLERFAARAAELVSLAEPVVLASDYNVLPEELGLYNPAGWEADALFRPETREAYRRLLAQGWMDALRHLNPGKQIFTFWDYTSGAWRRNAGMRNDHLLLNPAAAGRLAAA